MRRSSCVSGVSDARDGDAGCGAERGMSLGERGAEEEETRWRREGGTRCGILVMWKCSGWVEAWWCSGCGCRYEALWPCTRVCVYGYGVDGRWMADIVYGGGGGGGREGAAFLYGRGRARMARAYQPRPGRRTHASYTIHATAFPDTVPSFTPSHACNSRIYLSIRSPPPPYPCTRSPPESPPTLPAAVP